MFEKREKRQKVLQSDLFKKIKSDPRNNKELKKMIVNIHNKKEEKYMFYVDNKIQEFSANIVSSLSMV